MSEHTAMQEDIQQMRKALLLISDLGCNRFIPESGETCSTAVGLTKDSEYSDLRWCDACIASWGLS